MFRCSDLTPVRPVGYIVQVQQFIDPRAFKIPSSRCDYCVLFKLPFRGQNLTVKILKVVFSLLNNNRLFSWKITFKKHLFTVELFTLVMHLFTVELFTLVMHLFIVKLVTLVTNEVCSE